MNVRKLDMTHVSVVDVCIHFGRDLYFRSIQKITTFKHEKQQQQEQQQQEQQQNTDQIRPMLHG